MPNLKLSTDSFTGISRSIKSRGDGYLILNAIYEGILDHESGVTTPGAKNIEQARFHAEQLLGEYKRVSKLDGFAHVTIAEAESQLGAIVADSNTSVATTRGRGQHADDMTERGQRAYLALGRQHLFSVVKRFITLLAMNDSPIFIALVEQTRSETDPFKILDVVFQRCGAPELWLHGAEISMQLFASGFGWSTQDTLASKVHDMNVWCWENCSRLTGRTPSLIRDRRMPILSLIAMCTQEYAYACNKQRDGSGVGAMEASYILLMEFVTDDNMKSKTGAQLRSIIDTRMYGARYPQLMLRRSDAHQRNPKGLTAALGAIPDKKTPDKKTPDKKVPDRKDVCSVCKEPGHWARACPSATCRSCGNMGHTTSWCPDDPKSRAAK